MSFSPKPSMSSPPRLDEVAQALVTCAGHCRFGQRSATSPSARTVARAADRAAFRQSVRTVSPAAARDHLDDVRDHVAGALDEHAVADAHVEPVDLVLVVQGGVHHGDAADAHGLEHGDRRERAGAADRRRDLRHAGGRLARGNLKATAQRGARLSLPALAQRELVDLHDGAVDLVAAVLAALSSARWKRARPRSRRARVGPPSIWKPSSRRRSSSSPATDAELALAPAEAVGDQIERARGGDLRVELAQRAGGGVARVGVRLEPALERSAFMAREVGAAA